MPGQGRPFQKGQSGNPAGRPKGAKNGQAIAAAIADAKAILGDGLMPLAYLLAVMRDESQETEIRLEAAKAAAPYFHRKQPQAVSVDAHIQVEPVVFKVLGAPDARD